MSSDEEDFTPRSRLCPSRIPGLAHYPRKKLLPRQLMFNNNDDDDQMMSSVPIKTSRRRPGVPTTLLDITSLSDALKSLSLDEQHGDTRSNIRTPPDTEKRIRPSKIPRFKLGHQKKEVKSLENEVTNWLNNSIAPNMNPSDEPPFQYQTKILPKNGNPSPEEINRMTECLVSKAVNDGSLEEVLQPNKTNTNQPSKRPPRGLSERVRRVSAAVSSMQHATKNDNRSLHSLTPDVKSPIYARTSLVVQQNQGDQYSHIVRAPTLVQASPVKVNKGFAATPSREVAPSRFSNEPSVGVAPTRRFSARSVAEVAPNTGFSIKASAEVAPTRGFPDRPSVVVAPNRGFSARLSAEVAPNTGFSARPKAVVAPNGGFSARPTAVVAPNGGFSDRPSAVVAPNRGFSTRPVAEVAPTGGFSDMPTAVVAPNRGFSARSTAVVAPNKGFSARPTAVVAPHSADCGAVERSRKMKTSEPNPKRWAF